MLLNCGVGEDSWESFGLKELQPVHPKDQSWVFLEGLMLKLKVQSFGHLMRRANSFEKILMLGKIEGRRRREQRAWDDWMASLTQCAWVWINSGSWWWTGRPGMLQFMESQRVRYDRATELNWSELNRRMQHSFPGWLRWKKALELKKVKNWTSEIIFFSD